MRIAILDGDILVYQAASKVERPIRWNENLWTLHANIGEAKAAVRGYIQELKRESEADKVVVGLSAYGEPRFRKDILPSYKENRRDKRKPTVYFPLREYVKEMWETWERPRLEADDVLGILLTHDDFYGEAEKVVLTVDKDLLTIPGLHINWTHAREEDDWEPFEVTVEEANYRWMTQALTGDQTDGYGGCPGVGPVTADRVLPEVGASVEELWEAVHSRYQEEDLGGLALPTAQVARILRAEDYDYEAEEPIPWTPPTE